MKNSILGTLLGLQASLTPVSDALVAFGHLFLVPYSSVSKCIVYMHFVALADTTNALPSPHLGGIGLTQR